MSVLFCLLIGWSGHNRCRPSLTNLTPKLHTVSSCQISILNCWLDGGGHCVGLNVNAWCKSARSRLEWEQAQQKRIKQFKGHYSHKKEASTNVVRHRAHPNVAVLLQILGCDHCLKRGSGRTTWAVAFCYSRVSLILFLPSQSAMQFKFRLSRNLDWIGRLCLKSQKRERDKHRWECLAWVRALPLVWCSCSCNAAPAPFWWACGVVLSPFLHQVEHKQPSFKGRVKSKIFFAIICSMRLHSSKRGTLINIEFVQYDFKQHFVICCQLKMTWQWQRAQLAIITSQPQHKGLTVQGPALAWINPPPAPMQSSL